MLKQTIQFQDFNGETRTKDLYFNLTEAELVDMQASSPNGIQQDMEDAVKSKDMRKLLDFVKMLVHSAYGERDVDGIHFNKTPEITQRFVNSAMYSPLLMSLFQDEGQRTADFITGLMPADLVRRATEQARGQGNVEAPTPVGLSAREQFEARTQNVFDQPTQGTGFNEAPTIGLATGGGNPVMPEPVEVAPDPTKDAPQTDVLPMRQRVDQEEQRRQQAEEVQRQEFMAWKAARDAEKQQ